MKLYKDFDYDDLWLLKDALKDLHTSLTLSYKYKKKLMELKEYINRKGTEVFSNLCNEIKNEERGEV